MQNKEDQCLDENFRLELNPSEVEVFQAIPKPVSESL